MAIRGAKDDKIVDLMALLGPAAGLTFIAICVVPVFSELVVCKTRFFLDEWFYFVGVLIVIAIWIVLF